MTLSDFEYDEVKSFLKDAGFPSSVKKAELRVIKVGFSDGTAWNSGRVYRRSPSGPGKWRPVLSLACGKFDSETGKRLVVTVDLLLAQGV